MEAIKVIEVERYRDGGTVVYEDELNRRYFTWQPPSNNKPHGQWDGIVYNQMPMTGSIELKKSAKEIKVQLEIVDKF